MVELFGWLSWVGGVNSGGEWGSFSHFFIYFRFTDWNFQFLCFRNGLTFLFSWVGDSCGSSFVPRGCKVILLFDCKCWVENIDQLLFFAF